MHTPVIHGALLGGRYRLGSRLGGGGMADVYVGLDERLARPVAVKILRTDLARDARSRRRFEAEARATARLSHPNVVGIFDTGSDGDRSYIVMERVAGETLAERIAHGPINQLWLKRMTLEVLSALAAAHAAGILHRDIKPGNILITPEGHSKLSDFGIAKAVDAGPVSSIGAAEATVTGPIIGTPSYLAPERFQGRAATPQSDLYSLGIVLYEALTRHKPFAAQPEASFAPADAHRWPPDIRRFRPDADRRLVEVVNRAVDADPAARFASAADMTRVLYDTGPPTAPLASMAGPVAAPPAAGTVARPRERHRRRWRAALLATAVLAATPLLLLLLGGRHAASRTPALRKAAASTGTSPTSVNPAIPASSPASAATPATQPADPVASQLRDLALRLTPGDGQAASALAAGLDRIALLPPLQRARAATALLAQAASWYQHGQLTPTAYGDAITALTAAGGQMPQPPPPSAPAPAPSAPASDHGHGNGDQKGGSERGHD